jgi:hypothetical protein
VDDRTAEQLEYQVDVMCEEVAKWQWWFGEGTEKRLGYLCTLSDLVVNRRRRGGGGIPSKQ